MGFQFNCHKNDHDPLQCKRAFTFSSNTFDETRCIAKKWLLMGVDIAASEPDARDQHLRHIARGDIPIVDEAMLDAEAASLT